MSFCYGRFAEQIKKLTPGQPWMIGGYSQGAAVASSVYEATKAGGELYDWASGFLGGVCFGNPRRQVNYRGEVGGTWSGAWDVSGSTTGGHGSFPTTGPWARLTGCEANKWIEFAAPDDVITSTGDSTTGTNWTSANDALISLTPDAIPGYLLSFIPLANATGTAMALGNTAVTITDGAGNVRHVPGNGHVTYPFNPPVGNPDGGLTSYQIALKWLTAKANAWATAPISLPSTGVGWSTTLLPPAS